MPTEKETATLAFCFSKQSAIELVRWSIVGSNFKHAFSRKGKFFAMQRSTLLARRGGLGRIISWFIRIVIYDICITGISDVLGVSRMVALFIFLGILAVLAFGGYVIKQRVAPGVED